MKISEQYQADYDALPPSLRVLLDAELAAGNSIIEVGHSFPAPPAGAYFKLSQKIGTRPRQTDGGITFHDRNTSIYSGEFTDARRFYFILEPPNPPPPEPDMDAIRARVNTPATPIERPGRESASRSASAANISNVQRFRESMELNYERWKEGASYDLEAIESSSDDERRLIENILVTRGVQDWRDVEALAALDSDRAREVLRETLKSGKREYAAAVLRFSPELASKEERIYTLVSALEQTDFYAGLTQTLDQVAGFHPPEVIDALLCGVLRREGGHACHFAAMLMFLHGKAKSAFDWDHRPFYLEFNTPDRQQRALMFRELCGRIGVDPAKYLSR